MEDATISRNTFSTDGTKCRGDRVASAAIHGERVGQRAKYRTGGTLTSRGTTMTLNDGSAAFSQDDVGSSIQLCFAPDAGNNITAVVISVESSSLLTFTNPAGVGGGVAAGTYRIKPSALRGPRGGSLLISENQISAYGATGIETTSCVAPHCIGNTFDAIGRFADVGSVSPLYSGNRELTAGNNSAQIRITTGTSWPIIYDNFITNGALSGGNLLADGTPASAKTDMGIGVGSGESVDYPLCGKRGRVRPSDAKPENVLSLDRTWLTVTRSCT